MENILIPDICFDYYYFDVDTLITIFNLSQFRKPFITNEDNIISFREKRKLKNGSKGAQYSKNMRTKVRNSIEFLSFLGFIEYQKEENKYVILSKIKNKNSYLAPKKIITLNPKNSSWAKILALEIYKLGQKQIQIKKLFANIKIPIYFKPYKIRTKFEDSMDTLCLKKILKSWYYKNINEDYLTKKDWFYNWLKLSVIVKV